MLWARRRRSRARATTAWRLLQPHVRLQQIVIGPQAQGLDGAVHPGVPGEQDDLGVGGVGLDAGEQVQSGKPGQLQIQQGQVKFFLP